MPPKAPGKAEPSKDAKGKDAKAEPGKAEPGKDAKAEPGKEEPGKEGAEPSSGAPSSGAPSSAASSSDKDAKGNCIGKDSCPQPPVNFSAPKISLDGMKEKLDKGLQDSGQKVMTALTNPAKCAAIAVGAVPAMIDGVFNSIAGGFDKVAKSFNGVTTAASDQGFDGLLAPFKIGHAMFMMKIQDIIQRIALEPNFLSKPEFKGMSIKEVADQVVEKAGFQSDVFKKPLKLLNFAIFLNHGFKNISIL